MYLVYYSQDCLATIPPYPHYIGASDRGADYNVASSISDPDSMWIVRQQLFFTGNCTLGPISTSKCDSYNRCPEDIPLDLIFFSGFEDLRLRTTGTMESNGVRKLYAPSPVPTLYVGRVAGRASLGGCHSFHASLMATPPLPFRTSTLHDRAGLRIRVCRRSRPYITQGQPGL